MKNDLIDFLRRQADQSLNNKRIIIATLMQGIEEVKQNYQDEIERLTNLVNGHSEFVIGEPVEVHLLEWHGPNNAYRKEQTHKAFWAGYSFHEIEGKFYLRANVRGENSSGKPRKTLNIIGPKFEDRYFRGIYSIEEGKFEIRKIS